MRVGFATVDLSNTNPPVPGGSAWYRVLMPAKVLHARGHKVVWGHLVARRTGEFCIRDLTTGAVTDGLDVVVLQRWMQREVADDIPRARATGQAIANEVDDWFFGLDPANAAYTTTDPRLHPDQNRDHYRRALGNSTALVVSTDFLRGRFDRMFAGRVPVYCVNNGVDLDYWQGYEPERVRDPDRLVVGWLGATSWRSGDLETLRGVLGPWLARTGSRFIHAGHFPGHVPAGDLLGLDAPYGIAAARQTPDLRSMLTGFDVGIVPLADVPFNRAKSNIKGLEYTAAGIPFVAADLPEYRRFGGLLASNPRAWLRHLDRLRDPLERAKVRAANRARLPAWSLDARADAWERTYRAIMARADEKVGATTG